MSLTSNFDIFYLVAVRLDFRTILQLRLVSKEWKYFVDSFFKQAKTIKVITCRDDLTELSIKVAETSTTLDLNLSEILTLWNTIYISPRSLLTNDFISNITRWFPNVRQFCFYIQDKELRKKHCIDYVRLLKHWNRLTSLIISHVDHTSLQLSVGALNKCQFLRKLAIFEENNCWGFFKIGDRILHQLERIFLPTNAWIPEFTPRYLKAIGFKKIFCNTIYSTFSTCNCLHLPLISNNSHHTICETHAFEFIERFSDRKYSISSLEFSTLLYMPPRVLEKLVHNIDQIETLLFLKFSFIRSNDFQSILQAAERFRFVEVLHIDVRACMFNDLSNIRIEDFPKKMKNIRKIIIRPLLTRGLERFRSLPFSSLQYKVVIKPLIDISQIRDFPLPRDPGSRVFLRN